VGGTVGKGDGDSVGTVVGIPVGASDGDTEVGGADGKPDGVLVGKFVGNSVGALDGDAATHVGP